MYIITDVASLENIPEGMKASKIMILCGDGESFAAQDVSKMDRSCALYEMIASTC